MPLRSLIAVAVGLPIAVLGGLHAAALAISPRQPARALDMSPVSSAEAHARMAEASATKGVLVHHAQRVLRLRPLDGRAYRLLATMAPEERREPLYRVAASVSPRDVPTRAWFADASAVAGRHEESVRHLDALLDGRSALYEPLFPIMSERANEPQSRAAVFRALAADSPWRDGFLDWWTRQPPAQRAGMRPALEYLQAGGLLSPPRQAALARQLLAIDEPVAAVILDPPASHTRRSVDPQFQRMDESTFGWRTTEAQGWAISAPAQGDSQGLDLWVSRPAPTPGLVQTLMLPAGQYVVRARADVLGGPAQALQLRVACPGAKAIVLPWRQTRTALEVDARVVLARACVGGLLQLAPGPGASGGQQSRIALQHVELRPETGGDEPAQLSDPLVRAIAWVQSGSAIAQRGEEPVQIGPGSLVSSVDAVIRSTGSPLVAERLGGCRMRFDEEAQTFALECPPPARGGVPVPGRVQRAVTRGETPDLPTFAP